MRCFVFPYSEQSPFGFWLEFRLGFWFGLYPHGFLLERAHEHKNDRMRLVRHGPCAQTLAGHGLIAAQGTEADVPVREG